MQHLFLAAALAALASCAAVGFESPTPQRPTFSYGTATAAYGTTDLEVGYAFDPDDRRAVRTDFRYGYREDTELLLAVAAYEKVHVEGGPDGEGIGDVGLGVRHRLFEGAGGGAAAVGALVTLPTGDEDEGTGTGKVDWYFHGAGSLALPAGNLGGYLELGVLGDATDDETEVQRLLAVAWDQPLVGELGLVLEAAQFYRDGYDDPAFLTAAVTWPVGEHIVADFGTVLGLNHEAPSAAVLLGFTANLGILGAPGPTYTAGRRGGR